MHNAATGERSFKRHQRRKSASIRTPISRWGADVNIVFSKVDTGLKQDNQIDQRLLDGRDTATKRAAHLAGG